MIRPGSNYSVRLGNSEQGAGVQQIVNEFVVDASNPYITYYSAFVLENIFHDPYDQPFFEMQLYIDGTLIDCSSMLYVAPSDLNSGLAGVDTVYRRCDGSAIDPNNSTDPSIVYFRDWAPTLIDLKGKEGHTAKLVFTTADCAQGGHFGYAYLDISCLNGSIFIKNTEDLCKGRELQFSAVGVGNYFDEKYLWDFGDGASDTLGEPRHTYATAGLKHVTLSIKLPVTSSCSTLIFNQDITIPEVCKSCSECVTSFSPIPGDKYLLTAWVKESFAGTGPKTYTHSGVRLTFNNGTIKDDDKLFFRPKGPVVDGWQRVESSFVVPTNANNIQIELVNESTAVEAFFDDIRVHPFRSNMKSFVYDPSSQRLVAELDENNYATLYEYDDEGILVRVKKETERGVMTIKESRNNQSKINK
ncbi:MAG TPA: PKD domain-containing protein [Cytophagales bacterium]|nr:PKD domain-containing protein [Cytophagales bacterium]